MVSDKIIPIAASADPRRNAYYHRCHVHDQERAYAACLARIEGRLQDSPECDAAIAKTDCPAQLLRAQEETKGQAIYFVERTQVQSFIDKVRSWVMPDPYEKKEAPNKSMLDKMGLSETDGNIYKDIVNNYNKRPIKKLELKPGESPIDAIKRQRKEQ